MCTFPGWGGGRGHGGSGEVSGGVPMVAVGVGCLVGGILPGRDLVVPEGRGWLALLAQPSFDPWARVRPGRAGDSAAS
jgi:hypothetical protein